VTASSGKGTTTESTKPATTITASTAAPTAAAAASTIATASGEIVHHHHHIISSTALWGPPPPRSFCQLKYPVSASDFMTRVFSRVGLLAPLPTPSYPGGPMFPVRVVSLSWLVPI
jgi:hypothetical protein